MTKGFVPADEGPVSNTLEYAYDDWCVVQMAPISIIPRMEKSRTKVQNCLPLLYYSSKHHH